MKLCVSVLIVLSSLPLALAQPPDNPHAEAYVVAAPLGEASFGGRTTYVAGGAQAFLYRGLSIGAEVGPVITRPAGNFYIFGSGSANLSYYFLRAADDDKVEPFGTAGYSATFRAGVQNGWNVGAGVNVWLKKNMALRFELREPLGRLRIERMGPRFGVTFR